MSDLSRLLQVLRLLYQHQPADTETIEQQLIDQRKVAWFNTIRDEARALGYSVVPNPPRFQDLDWIRSESRQDAQSISNTWNRDVERQLIRLYEANPRGNRFYYMKHMEEWAANRDDWKARQIATQTEFSTVGYTKRRFQEENGLRGALHVFTGPPPVCQECVGHFAAGVVDQKYVDQNPTPIHIGCPHTWKLVTGSLPRGAIPRRSDLWVG